MAPSKKYGGMAVMVSQIIGEWTDENDIDVSPEFEVELALDILNYVEKENEKKDIG